MKLDKVQIQKKIQSITNSPIKIKLEENASGESLKITIQTALFKLTADQLDEIRKFLSGIVTSSTWTLSIQHIKDDDPFWHYKWAGL